MKAAVNVILRALLVFSFLAFGFPHRTMYARESSLENSYSVLWEAYSLRVRGELDSSLQLLGRQIQIDPAEPALYFEYARGLFYAMKLDSAAWAISQANRFAPQNYRYHHFAGLIATYQGISDMHKVRNWLQVPGEFRRAVNCFEYAVSLEAECYNSRIRLIELYSGLPWYLSGSKRLALQHAEILETLDPVYGLMARCAAERSMTDEERIRRWEAAVQSHPKHGKAHACLARAYISAGRYDQSEAQIDKALQLDKSCSDILLYAGLKYIQVGKLSQAEEKFDQYLYLPGQSVVPRQTYAMVQLARIQNQRGNTAVAETLLTDARRRDPYCWETMAPPPEELFDLP